MGLALLRKYNNNLIFSRQDWVRELLEHAKSLGKKYFDLIRDHLFFIGIPKSKQGTAGEPMPQDVALVENSQKAMELSKYDYEKKFYLDLKQHGEKEIEEDKARNERHLD